MKVTRYRYLNSVDMDKGITYAKAEVVQLDHNSHWPGSRFMLKTMPWPDNAEKPEGYESFVMNGAESFYHGNGFWVTGFVQPWMESNSPVWYLERWYVTSK